MNPQTFIAFVSYFAILLTIGLIAHKKNTSEADFIIGNRSLNFWVTALSAHASDMSAWLFMAFPMTILIGGLSQTWIAFGLVAGMFLNWHFVAPKLRIATEKYGCYTLSTFFEKRFMDHSGAIRLISATMALVFLTHYLSAGLIAMGFLFESLFGVDYYIGISFASLIVVIYTFVGGFITVAWTDLFQGVFLLVMIIIVPAVAFFQIEGIEAITQAAAAKDISLSFVVDPSFDSILNVLSLMLGWGLGYFGMPHVITKFMGIKSADELYKAKYLGISWQILALTAAGIVGLIGIAYFKEPLANPELVFVEMVKDLFNPLFAGFILCGVIAANMSTMDSQILVCASVLTEDFYKHLFRREAVSKELLRVSRVSVILIALIALVIALNKSSSILDTVLYSWSGLGCSFGPMVLLSLYSTRVNKYGAIAGILTGGIVAGMWPYLNSLMTHYTIFPMIPGFFASLAVNYGVSLLTNKPNTQAAKNI